MQDQRNDVSNRELVIARLLDAPVELAWEAWTNPEHVKHWWGPDGFSNTITKMDVIPGGEWDIIMHAPDGTDHFYKCHFIGVIKYQKIVYQHRDWPKFVGTVDFEKRSNQTFVHWQMLFENGEMLRDFIKRHNADEGIKQNMGRLEYYLINKNHQS